MEADNQRRTCREVSVRRENRGGEMERKEDLIEGRIEFMQEKL